VTLKIPSYQNTLRICNCKGKERFAISIYAIILHVLTITFISLLKSKIHLKICHVEIQQVDCSKYLGIFIDSIKLSWQNHIDYIYNKNSSGDEIANVNFLYDDIVHVLQNTIDSCINPCTARRGGYVLERMFTKSSEIITQCNGH